MRRELKLRNLNNLRKPLGIFISSGFLCIILFLTKIFIIKLVETVKSINVQK